METKEKAEAERLTEQTDVKQALEQTTAKTPAETGKQTKLETREKVSLGGYVVVLLIFGVLDYLVRTGVFDFLYKYLSFLTAGENPLLPRLTRGAILITLVLGIAKAAEIYLIG